MKKELLIPWYHSVLQEPIKVSFDGIRYDGSGMQIFLREVGGEKRLLSFFFPDLPMAVRITNESQRLVSLRLLSSDSRHSLYCVQNSSFMNWLNSDSLDIYKDDPLFHLAIITDEWIDIICNDNPIITVIDDECSAVRRISAA
ncbi:MAG: hypothetical protein WAW42_01585 [Candidatus Competibacteraceae bacterium]